MQILAVLQMAQLFTVLTKQVLAYRQNPAAQEVQVSAVETQAEQTELHAVVQTFDERR